MTRHVSTDDPLLDVRNLVVRYPGAESNAVDDVSFDIRPGETFGLVGESGCGKSSVARAIVGLHDWSGTIDFSGQSLSGLGRRGMRPVRRRLQMIFQDPYGTLDPRMRVGDQIAEPLLVHGMERRGTVTARVADLLADVGLDPALARRYPHQLSGGQRQRISIARAIGLGPRLLVCDEATSALDVSVQAQILDLLERLRAEHDLAILFIAHNLAIVRRLCDRVGVMYRGKLVESGPAADVLETPQDAYTRALLDAVLEPDPAIRNASRASVQLTRGSATRQHRGRGVS